jgi:phosphoribosyl 1,2-cyclic phosphodiesterase
VLEQVAGCGTLLLECNHDAQMLAQSAYPAFLKRRVGGAYGHLANLAAAEIARALQPSGLKQLVAAHLSENNNRPDLVRQALAAALCCAETDIQVADAASGSGWLSC